VDDAEVPFGAGVADVAVTVLGWADLRVRVEPEPALGVVRADRRRWRPARRGRGAGRGWSCGCCGAAEEVGQSVVDAGGGEVGFAVERLADVVDAVFVVVEELDDGEDVGVGGVEGVVDLVLGDGDGVGAGDAALDFDEAQASGGGVVALDVVAALLELDVGRFVPEGAFDVAMTASRARRALACVSTTGRSAWGSPREVPKEADREDDGAGEHAWCLGADVGFEVEFVHAGLEACLEVLGASVGFARVEFGVGLAGFFLGAEVGGAVVPVGDLLGEASWTAARVLSTQPRRCCGLGEVVGHDGAERVIERAAFDVAR
jgi:hypothetical protein